MQEIVAPLFKNLITLEKTESTNALVYRQSIENVYDELIQFHFKFVDIFSNILKHFKLSQTSYSIFVKEFESKLDLIYSIRKCFKDFKKNLDADFHVGKDDSINIFINSILKYFEILIWEQLDNYYNINDTFRFENTRPSREDNVSINYQLVYFLSSFLVCVKQGWSDISFTFVDCIKVK